VEARFQRQRYHSLHHSLISVAKKNLNLAQKQANGNPEFLLATLALTAFSLEAFLNAVGVRLVSDWPKDKRVPVKVKMAMLCAKLEIDQRKNEVTLHLLHELIDFRNDIAHGKPEHLEESETVIGTNFIRQETKRPLARLETQLSLDLAKRLIGAFEEFRSIVCEKTPVDKRIGLFHDTVVTTAQFRELPEQR
jgi:hypothetical protein